MATDHTTKNRHERRIGESSNAGLMGKPVSAIIHSGNSDPRRARDIITRIRGVADKRRAYLFIDGQRWAIVEWGGKGRWCIEDNEHLCLDHIVNAPGLRSTLNQAITLAQTMIRDGSLPSPEEAKQLAEERSEKQRQQSDAWQHPERLYEPLADTLELWADRDPDFTRSNTYRRLLDELIAIAEGAIGHFEQARASALRGLQQIELESGRSRWYGNDSDRCRGQVAYAEEHIERAQQIIRTHDPDRRVTATTSVSAEQVIEEARTARTAREARKQRRDPDGSRRARGRWHRNIAGIRYETGLLTDDELRWFTTISKEGFDKNANDALRLEALRETVSRRWCDRQFTSGEAEREHQVERLKRLGLESDCDAGGAP